MALLHLHKTNFEQEVLTADRPVLVYFTTPRCGPCQMVIPIVEELANDWREQIKVGRLDIYENFRLTLHYVVLKAPTLLLFVHGRPVVRLVGYKPKPEIIQQVQAHLP